jgi:hypothetical protein
MRVSVARLMMLVLLCAALWTLAMPGAALAKVHGVSQAGCADDPSRSGANMSGSNSPDAPIPVTASDGRAPGAGGDGDGACDTAAVAVRQN